MTRILVCTLLLLSMPMIGEQQPQDQNPAALDTRSSSDNSAQAQESEQSLQDKGEGNERIQDNIQSAFDGDPILDGTDLGVNVDDKKIILTGTVESYLQHQRVLELVSPYFNYREIVDKVKIH
jgi:osmotically-inducible protein OsmY